MNQLELFPDYKNVFKENISEYENVLFPMFSINLSSVNAELPDEYIHLLQFNEDPYNTDTVKYFSEYCKDRMISFSFENGLYSFSTDIRYFDLTENWEKYLGQTKADFINAKSRHLNGEGVIKEKWYKVGGVPEWLQDDETPRDQDGNPMIFIAQFDTLWMFNDCCPKTIYLFYSNKYNLAVELYQIT